MEELYARSCTGFIKRFVMSLARLLTWFVLVLASPFIAESATLTSDTIEDAVVYGFDGGPRLQGTGPYTRSIGNNSFIFTSTNSFSVFDTDGLYGFSSNGQWTQNAISHAGLNAGGDQYMAFTFQTPVQAVGAFMKYAYSETFNTFSDARLRIRDATGTVLETFNLSQSAPILSFGVNNDGAFRGFEREAADIKSFEVVGGYLAIADLTITETEIPEPEPPPPPVPLPASGILLLVGLLGLAGYRLRFSHAKTATLTC